MSHCALDIFATGKHVNHREIYNPCIFMDMKRPLNWLKSKIAKVQENFKT